MIPEIVTNIIYDNNTNIIAWIIPTETGKGGNIDIIAQKIDKKFDKNKKNKMYFHHIMPKKLWEIIKNNMNPDSENKKFLDLKINIFDYKKQF